MKKLTAIEWLIDQVEDYLGDIPTEFIEQAKEMEKEQMVEFTKDWYNSYWQTHPMKSPEKFYNETFKNK